jgi:hypothetical protein
LGSPQQGRSVLRASAVPLAAAAFRPTWLENDFVPRRLFILIGALPPLLLAASSHAQSFAPPPVPSSPGGPSSPSAVRGIQDGVDPLASPAAPAMPAGAEGIPAATFVSPSAAVDNASSAGNPAIIPTDATPILGSEIIGRVEDQVILASDVLWQVHRMIASMEKQKNMKVPPEQLPQIERILLERMLLQLIDTKLLFADFRRTLPPENLTHVEKTLAEPFEASEIPKLFETYGVKDRVALNAALATHGSSLKDVQRQYTEKMVAGEWLRQRMPKLKVVTHEEMLAYYQDHLKEYEYPGSIKWEELMVRFDRFNGDRNAAWKALAEMGNEVWAVVAINPGLRGPVFANIAKAKSHGFTAAEGGIQESTPGSLACEELNQALATLELGRMSNCIESPQGFHLVRVLERKEPGRTPFTEAQASIRDLLEAEQKEALLNDELVKLRKTARVWTIFHGDLNGERLSEMLDEKQRK